MQHWRRFITEANEYRAYIIGPDGHILRRVDLLCADDDAAKERARAMVDPDDLADNLIVRATLA